MWRRRSAADLYRVVPQEFLKMIAAPGGRHLIPSVRVLNDLACAGLDARLHDLSDFLQDDAGRLAVEQALRIRAVENGLLDFFGRNKLHGTIHTCVGQEFSGVLLGQRLVAGDFVTSNHRCHGHFIAATNDWMGLIDELAGNADGVCAGIGSSQHLCAENFISNGQQAGLLPVGAGVALQRKKAARGNIVVSFIGEGTLGEGVFYETVNIACLWRLPHILVCENNGYSQSTPQSLGVSGDIAERVRAFGMRTYEANIWNLSVLRRTIAEMVEYVRSECAPALLVLACYRLNAHSKGDDLRDPAEVLWFRERDPLSIVLDTDETCRDLYKRFQNQVDQYIEAALIKPKLKADSYWVDQLPHASAERVSQRKRLVVGTDKPGRASHLLNDYYRDWLRRNAEAMLIGEDIMDPYGGAFKITKGLQQEFPERVLSTPISEAAIMGVGIGLSISNRRAMVEIMFGDFITYAFDQILNNASKFFHMYNRKISCPVILRAPMGGRRGYGPTHSQSLERFLIGIDNLCVLSLNTLIPPSLQLISLDSLECPVIIVENKADYANFIFSPTADFIVEIEDAAFPTIRITPMRAKPTVTILSYGGVARLVADNLINIFEQTDLVPELIVPTSIHPLDLSPILASVGETGRLATVEEGALFGGLGGEAIARVHAELRRDFRSVRIGCKPVPVPSEPTLEDATLPNVDTIFRALSALKDGS